MSRYLPLVLLILAVAPGCGLRDLLLGTHEGEYLFTAYDVLALPGEEATVRVRLEGGQFLHDQARAPVRFMLKSNLIGTTRTDKEGFAAVQYNPAEPGDYVFTAATDLEVPREVVPDPVAVRICCRAADAPLLILDLDKTLVASGFRTVLTGNPVPMPHSREVVTRLARDYTVVYLTQRPEFLSLKSKAWLRENNYPAGPVLLSPTKGMLSGNAEYKGHVLSGIRKRFTGPGIGVGDKPSDILVYRENGLQAFLIVTPDMMSDAKDLREMAAKVAALPPDVQAVTDWAQIREAVLMGVRHPCSDLAQKLRERAALLEGAKASPPAPPTPSHNR